MNQQLHERQKNVMRSLAIMGHNRDLIRDASGEATVVVALPNETLDMVMKRVARVDTPFNLVIAFPDRFRILIVGGPIGRHGVLEVSPTTSMGMLLARIDRNANRAIKLDMQDRDDLTRAVELLPQFSYA